MTKRQLRDKHSLTVPVSVIIPCYCCRQSIGRALASVVSQTVLPREVVLVDDASPDGGETLRAMKWFANKYGSEFTVKLVLSERNGGPGSARNRGWEVATQPYLAFLDSDDAWHARKIEIQYAWMRDNSDFGLTGHRHILSLSEEPAWPFFRNADTQKHIKINAGMLYSNAFATRTIMLRRDLPFRFKDGKRYAEDYLLCLQMILSGVKAVRIDIPLAVTFKPDFGAGGLSVNLWQMERGELECYWELHKQRLISIIPLLTASTYSLLKFVRRYLVTSLRKDDRKSFTTQSESAGSLKDDVQDSPQKPD